MTTLLDDKWDIQPDCIGPTWTRNEDWDGISSLFEFVLPQYTLGWQILDWIEDNLVGADGRPFDCTAEQKRFILWWYAIDEDGRFIYRDGVLQRLKGWGKDPLIAVICAVEFLGPCRFLGWATRDMPEIGICQGEPVAGENIVAWIDVAAVSKDQTINTMSIFPLLFSEKCKKAHGIRKQDLGKEIIHAHGGSRRIRAVTSSPRSLEGGRATFVVRNETHHWLSSNNGHAMAEVIERNATKSAGGSARALSITNAYDPSERSVAQIQREAWEAESTQRAIDTGILYDSLEISSEYGLSPPREEGEPPPTEAEIRSYLGALIRAVRGDAWWLDIVRITNSILSKQNTPSTSRRFWLNQITASEDAWLDPRAIEAGADFLALSERQKLSSPSSADMIRAGWIVSKNDAIAVFGDGSKSDDATALVGRRLSDGFTFLIGLWAKPSNASEDWLVPRAEVDQRVHEMFKRFNIMAFWFDPSHTLDDDHTRYWDGLIDSWHRTYKDRLKLWAVKTGPTQHSIMWDMTSPQRHAQFVAACELTKSQIENRDKETGKYAPLFKHCGHPALKWHLGNAKLYPVTLVTGKFGVSIRKEGRESLKKIDIATCVVGANMLGRFVMNAGLEEEKPKGGWAYGV